MAIGLICPSCFNARLVNKPLPNTCERCGFSYPGAQIEEASACLAGQRSTLGVIFSLANGPGGLLRSGKEPAQRPGQLREAVVFCPTCKSAATWIEDDDGVCPECEREFPNDLKAAATAAIHLQPPGLLSGAVPMLIVNCVVFVWRFVRLILDSPDGIPSKGVEHSTDAATTTYATTLIYFAIWSGVLAWGFWRQRSWTRPVCVAGWTFVNLGTILVSWPTEEWELFHLMSLVSSVIGCSIIFWYFYGKQRVVEHYRALAIREGEDV